MKVNHTAKRIAIYWVFLLVFSLGLPSLHAEAQEQDQARVQQIEGRLEAEELHYYLLQNLEVGETLYVFVENRSGNLDPFTALLSSDADPVGFEAQITQELAQALREGEDPLAALPEVIAANSLAFSDDLPGTYSAGFQYRIRREGDYRLALGGFLNAFGDYRLLVGVDSPEILDGRLTGQRSTLATFDREYSSQNAGIQIFRGELNADRPSSTLPINTLRPGDTLYVHASTLAGNLRPVLVVRDFGGKPVATANLQGNSTLARLTFTAESTLENYTLSIGGCCDITPQSMGRFKIVAGVNTPEVQQGQGEEFGRPPLQLPINVNIGVRLQQITDVNQQAENYSAVATLRMEWQDPRLAFNPEECGCAVKVYQDANFKDFENEFNDRWPSFTLFNQQGNRWTQNRVIAVNPDGSATFVERFTTTFQAPDFDFTRYPFDNQTFYIRVDNVRSDDAYRFINDEEYTAIGTQLGEEEWVVIDDFTEISTVQESTNYPVSRFSFGFEVSRHLSYYILRIFVPVVLIVLVSWFTFFLKDFGKRVDVSAGNLLVFVAFNFTVAGDLPRLGYLTLLDSILLASFILTALTVIYTVALARGKEGRLRDQLLRLDSILIWAYPLIYIGTFIFLILRVL